jgi:hypothetical protein
LAAEVRTCGESNPGDEVNSTRQGFSRCKLLEMYSLIRVILTPGNPVRAFLPLVNSAPFPTLDQYCDSDDEGDGARGVTTTAASAMATTAPAANFVVIAEGMRWMRT